MSSVAPSGEVRERRDEGLLRPRRPARRVAEEAIGRDDAARAERRAHRGVERAHREPALGGDRGEGVEDRGRGVRVLVAVEVRRAAPARSAKRASCASSAASAAARDSVGVEHGVEPEPERRRRGARARARANGVSTMAVALVTSPRSWASRMPRSISGS